jgi:heme exporter protein A
VALALDVRDVSKRYGRRWALARLSFKLLSGRSLLLTGHNGSGKTTLLKLLATSLMPTAGQLSVLGRDVFTERDAIRSQVSLLTHTNFLYEDLTAEQNLVFLGRLLKMPAPAEAARFALAQVGLESRAKHPVRHFSAGMRKRLAIARLLIKGPSLALLDEPFGELDPQGIAQMEELINKLKRRGVGIILATHLVDQGMSLCDERLHLHEGRRVDP